MISSFSEREPFESLMNCETFWPTKETLKLHYKSAHACLSSPHFYKVYYSFKFYFIEALII